VIEGQGTVGDETFHDSDRYMVGIGIWCDEDWYGKDKDSKSRNQ
jgi:hypothetical protein